MEITNEILKEITGNMDTGLKTFIHKETLQVVAIPNPDQFYDDLELWQDDIKLIKKNKKKFIEIQPMSSRENYRVMEAFVESIEEKPMKDILLQAIEGHKPFANFKIQIDNSGPYREVWFSFKSEQTTEWVRRQLEDLG